MLTINRAEIRCYQWLFDPVEAAPPAREQEKSWIGKYTVTIRCRLPRLNISGSIPNNLCISTELRVNQ